LNRLRIVYAASLAALALQGCSSAAPKPRLVFASQPASTFQGEVLALVAVELRDDGGKLVTTGNSQVTVSGAGVAGTLTVSLSGGRATFSDLHVDSAAQGATLSASLAGQAALVSSLFDVKALTLHFDVAPPAGAFAGDMNPIQVSFRGPDNQVAPIARAVTISLQPSGTLSGTLKQSSVAGLATFSDVAFAAAAAGLSLRATADNVTQIDAALQPGYTTTEIEPLDKSAPGAVTNDTFGTAEAIRAGVAVVGTLPAGDVDWYKFNATAGQILTASTYVGRFDPTKWDSDVRLRLVAPDGTSELWRNENGSPWGGYMDRGFSQVVIPATGQYYLVTEIDGATITGRYALLFTLANANLQVETEAVTGGGNDTRATAQAIVPGTVSGFYEGTLDYYKITIAAPTRVRLELNGGRNGYAGGGSAYWDSSMSLEDGAGDLTTSGTALWNNDDSIFWDSTVDYVLTTPGDYYVRVDKCCSNGPTPYLLTYDAQPWSVTADPGTNLSPGAAMPVAYGQTFGGAYAASDVRYYKLTGKAGDRVRLREFDSSWLDGTAAVISVQVLDALAAPLTEVEQTYPYHLLQTILAADGDYTIAVTNGTTAGNVGLMLELIGQTAREAEPNDDAAHATPFPAEGHVSGAIGAPGDQDQYSLHAEAGQLVSVSLFASGGAMNAEWIYSSYGSNLVPHLEIRDGAGSTLVLVGRDQAQPYAESVVRPIPSIEASFVAPAAGTYYAVVTNADPTVGDATYTYSLDLLYNQ
jgi:hypothetical protein